MTTKTPKTGMGAPLSAMLKLVGLVRMLLANVNRLKVMLRLSKLP